MTSPAALTGEAAWSLLLALRAAVDGGAAPVGARLGFDRAGAPRPDAADPAAEVTATGWTCRRPMSEAAAQLLDLHLPLLRRRDFVVAQLGQSLDGRIATQNGHSYYVTGEANRTHLHRLRALMDAVVVGAGTVKADDPRLTVRLTEGPQPVRVVLDTRRRLSADYTLFTDGRAPTLLCCAEGEGAAGGMHGDAEVLPLPAFGEGLDPAAVLAALRARGVRRILVEGGGVTVSRFLAAGLLDRLHVGVAPLIIGSGRPGLTLPEIGHLNEAQRPRVRAFAMPPDTLFDCDLRAASSA